MPKVDNEIIINAPVQGIFDYISQPSNLQQIWPSLVEITNQTLLPNGGYRYSWVYKMAGIHFSGTGECMDMEPNLVLASKNHGTIDSIVSFKFLSIGGRTKVSLTIDYQVPIPLLGQLTEMIILKMNAKEVGLILDNLRIRFEEN
jgi:uncharacterized membrane protein